jgi:hypothetical protein
MGAGECGGVEWWRTFNAKAQSSLSLAEKIFAFLCVLGVFALNPLQCVVSVGVCELDKLTYPLTSDC